MTLEQADANARKHRINHQTLLGKSGDRIERLVLSQVGGTGIHRDMPLPAAMHRGP